MFQIVFPDVLLRTWAILVGNTTDYSFINAVIAIERYQDVDEHKK